MCLPPGLHHHHHSGAPRGQELHHLPRLLLSLGPFPCLLPFPLLLPLIMQSPLARICLILRHGLLRRRRPLPFLLCLVSRHLRAFMKWMIVLLEESSFLIIQQHRHTDVLLENDIVGILILRPSRCNQFISPVRVEVCACELACGRESRVQQWSHVITGVSVSSSAFCTIDASFPASFTGAASSFDNTSSTLLAIVSA